MRMLSMLPSMMPMLVAAVAVPAIVAVFVARPLWGGDYDRRLATCSRYVKRRMSTGLLTMNGTSIDLAAWNPASEKIVAS
jgi:hypothetical protein